jgi:hypothetical protein
MVKGGSISIRINDVNSSYFRHGKGLRQGDPLSPLLFNMVVDVFTRMLSKAALKGYISGFMDDVYPGGVISLQYADDTLLFLSHNKNVAVYLKWIMIFFCLAFYCLFSFCRIDFCFYRPSFSLFFFDIILFLFLWLMWFHL